MSPVKKFASRNNLSGNGFSAFPPALAVFAEGLITGLVFCVLMTGVLHMMLGLWVFAFVLFLIGAAFTYGLRQFHNFAWGR